MQKPRALKPGNTIGILAPASNVDPEALGKGVDDLRKKGYQVRLSSSIYAQQRYFAGPHQQRARDLDDFFVDPGIDAIMCARGGYGCHHLLPYLEASKIRENPKVFIGYSDITVLLQCLENQCHVVCFHGPMVAREFGLGEPYYDYATLNECITRVAPGQRITADNVATLRSGTVEGRLTGGCLSLLSALLGTKYEIETHGKILFLEDVNTKPYQIDRMLMHLRIAGKFDGVRGVIFGEMLNCQFPEGESRDLQSIIGEVLSDFQFPILYGLPSGHTSSGALTLPFGIHVRLNAEEGFLELLEPAVQ